MPECGVWRSLIRDCSMTGPVESRWHRARRNEGVRCARSNAPMTGSAGTCAGRPEMVHFAAC
jgi:hypothetical protein